MKNKGLIATIVVLIAVIITLIAVVFLMQMPTILSNDNWASRFLNKKETSIISTTEIAESKNIAINETTEVLPKLTTTIENYNGYKDHVSIDYPQIVGMDDKSMQEKINNKIKTNALSIVPLYPISTAVQDLTVSCEVKYLDEEYITIIYEGRVVGVKSGSSSSSGRSTSGSKSNYSDPYLDGFVDPLSIYGQNINQMNIMPQTNPAINYIVPTTANNNAEITYNPNSTNNNISPSAGAANTADKGPVVTDIKSPTAPHANTNIAAENYSTNNPTGNTSPIISNNYTSSGTYYSQSGTQNVAPTETSAGYSNVYSLPVSGFANTNASDIDQRIYYTNTINLKTGLDMRLSDYVKDFDALAKYLRSSKVEFANIDDSDRKQVREYVNKTVQSKYVEQMRTADFRNEGVSSWPKIFSYRDTDGTVYFSVKLSSKLGNYAIVKYQQ